eukprot:Gregarina_sp_Pseudo_9__1438@NODE_1964_length_1230_cov_401_258606_g1819_i0_p2_GENE_NODE_1964_length_1230_cov_401_258606_g1819_i0NODE_1964_length_1230_cov_401_258606_g1819_i0_p2_ORF_typecomplete_len338_score59_78Aldo_ket_red/PF00248_21/1_2e41_NODE_1964_length_1230_cov_401_258606_g1819_i01181131
MTKTILCGKFHNGVLIPAVGYGTWELENNNQTIEVIANGLSVGYRHVDTALGYDNHQACAKGIQNGEKQLQPGKEVHPFGQWVAVSQEEFEANFSVPHGRPVDGDRKTFITSKIFTDDFTPAGIAKAVDRITSELLRPVDLILLHWPGAHPAWGAPESEPTNPKNPETRIACWKALETAYAQKKVRAIGVSNYAEKHLVALLDDIKARQRAGDAQAIIPMVNQFELSPLLSPRHSLVEIVRNNNIMITSYSTLGSKQNPVLKNPKILAIAKKLSKTPSQVVIRWCLQNGYLCIPRTSNKEHAKENYDFDFELSNDMMDEIHSLHCDHRRCPNPLEFS